MKAEKKSKIAELRLKDEQTLLKEMYEARHQLLDSRTCRAAGTNPQRRHNLGYLKKQVARILTIFNEKRIAAAKVKYEGSKYVPKDLKEKRTRALRRRLPRELADKKTVKAQKKASNLPLRRYVVLQATE